jgi:riboflavin biosynthesis pyrimidine reductase
MLLTRCLPAGPPVPARDIYTSLDLGARAPADRPYVVSNFVASADGRTTVGGRTAPLSGSGDIEVFSLLRTQADAVLIGAETVRVERYAPLVSRRDMLGFRLDEGRAEQPLAIVVSRSGRMPEDIPLFNDPASRVLFFTSSPLPGPGAWAAEVSAHQLDPGPGPLASMMRTAYDDYGVRSVLCEGGPSLLGSLLAEGLLDEYFLTVSPSLAGAAELGIASGAFAPQAMQLIWVLEHEDEIFLRYARERS